MPVALFSTNHERGAAIWSLSVDVNPRALETKA